MIRMSRFSRKKMTVLLARWISIVGHPFILLTALTFLIAYSRGGIVPAIRIAGLLVGVVVLPLLLFIRRRLARGVWQTIDASSPKDRPALFLAAFAAIVPLSLWFMLAERSADLLRGLAAAAMILVTAAVLNHRVKLSLHMAFAVFAAFFVVRLWHGCAVIVLIFLPGLAWSRLILLRHTIPQVIGGTLLGAAAASLAIWA
jgi:hypothetical protein